MDTRHTHSSTVARPMVSTSERAVSRPIEKPIDFTLNLPQAQSVSLVGTFNKWDSKRTPMRRDPVAGWKTTIWLPKGRYEYRFVADGQWISDPNARESVRNPFGTTNSVLVV
jgi:1,4-alpha-glucan branching enzyme